jgi:HEAT repeat protein
VTSIPSACLGAWLACWAAPGGENPLDEARKLAQSSEPRDRERAARRAADQADRAAAELLLILAADEHAGVRQSAVAAMRRLAEPTARDLVCRAAAGAASPATRASACEAAGAYAADVRRPALERALVDRHPTVRAAAARACAEGTGPDPALAAVLRERIADRDDGVRCAALEALARLDPAAGVAACEGLARDRVPMMRIARLLALEIAGDQEALRAAAVAALADREWPVRAAAIECLGRVGSLEVAAPLVAALRTAQGRLRRDCTTALQKLSGKTIGPDADLWEAWLAAQWGSTNGGGMRDRPKGAPDTVARFYELPIESEHLVFILDLSRSMGDPPKEGGPPRIETAKAAIAKAVAGLGLTAYVNAVTFGQGLDRFQPRSFLATAAARAQLTHWIQKRLIGGGTNIYDSLMMALEDPRVDSIYLVSDGGASVGTFIDNDDIGEQIARANRYRRVAINCIAVGETRKGRSLLRALAERNAGAYVER